MAAPGRTDNFSDESDICDIEKELNVFNIPRTSTKKGSLDSLPESFEFPKAIEKRTNELFDKFKELREENKRLHNRALALQRLDQKRRIKRLERSRSRAKFEQPSCSISSSREEDGSEWKDLKPFLSVNEHIQESVSHGMRGPKTQLETMIDDAIKNGDLDKAELLSDHLADRQFAVKIDKAFAAKKYHTVIERKKKLKLQQRIKKQLRKIRLRRGQEEDQTIASIDL